MEPFSSPWLSIRTSSRTPRSAPSWPGFGSGSTKYRSLASTPIRSNPNAYSTANLLVDARTTKPSSPVGRPTTTASPGRTVPDARSRSHGPGRTVPDARSRSRALAAAVAASDELDLEAVAVLQVAGAVLGSARIRVVVGEHQGPPVARRGIDQIAELRAASGVEGEMVQP